jgi:PAS domain-containing protein
MKQKHDPHQTWRKGSVSEQTAELDRRNAEIVRANRYLDSIVGCMLDALVIVSLEGTIRTANPALLRRIGYSRDELTGAASASFSAIPPMKDCSRPAEETTFRIILPLSQVNESNWDAE